MTTNILEELKAMSEENADVPQDVSMFLLRDLLSRVRDIEGNNLHPRLQTVEQSIEEIKSEFKEIRLKQDAASNKSDDNFRILSDKIEHSIEQLAERQDLVIEGIFQRLNSIGRKLAYWAGIGTVVLGIVSALLMYGDKILPVLINILER